MADESDDGGEGAEERQITLRHQSLHTICHVRIVNEHGKANAYCNFCPYRRMSYKLDRLIDHGRDCKNIPPSLRASLVDEVSQYRTARERSRSIADAAGRKNQKRLDTLLVQFIADNCLPIRIVESIHLKEILLLAYGNQKIPGIRQVRNLIAEESLRIRQEEIANIQTGGKSSIAIEFDGWTSIAGGHLLVIVVTLSSGRSFLLDIQDVSSIRHYARNLADLVVKSIREAKINLTYVNSIVTDEAANYKLARSYICDSINSPRPIEYRCMAHLMNLIGERMARSPEITATLSLASSLVNIISRHRLLASRLAAEGAQKVIHIVATRWYTTSNCLNSLLAIRDPLSRLPIAQELSADQWGPILDDNNFWIDLSELAEYYNNLSSYIGVAESSNSLLSDSFRGVLEFARFCVRKPAEDRIRCIALSSMSYHFAKVDHRLVFAAYILNPNHKMEYLRESAFLLGKSGIIKILLGSECTKEEIIANLASEIKIYLKMVTREQPYKPDIYSWWEQSSLKYLKTAGMRLARCRASSANTERIFSSLGLLMTSRRNRMSIETLHDLANIRLHCLSTKTGRPARVSRSQGSSQGPSQAPSQRPAIEQSRRLSQQIDDNHDDEVEELENFEPNGALEGEVRFANNLQELSLDLDYFNFNGLITFAENDSYIDQYASENLQGEDDLESEEEVLQGRASRTTEQIEADTDEIMNKI